MSATLLSLIVCTFNRARYSRRLLLSLVAQCRPYPDVEIIVVDNNSSDYTRASVERLISEAPFIRYVFEKDQGLSHARNRGATEARGTYLLFLDDDAIAIEGFVATMRNLVLAKSPDFFGGPIYPIYADRLPEGFPASMEIRKKADVSGFHRDIALSGGNFGVRRKALEKLGGFDPRYGMTGAKVGMLEERVLIDTYREATPADRQRLYYDLDAFVFHHTPAQRLTSKFQETRTAIAHYQLAQRHLQRGVRARGKFYAASLHLLGFELKRVVGAAINPRASRRDRFKASLELARAIAVAKACAEDALSSPFRARTKSKSDAALRLLWVRFPGYGKKSQHLSREVRDQEFIAEAFEHIPVQAEPIDFVHEPTNADLLARIFERGPEGFDAILFDQKLSKGVIRVLREQFPFLQIIIRLTRSKFMMFADQKDFSWRSFDAISKNFERVRLEILRDRDSVRFADLVVESSDWERCRYLRIFGPGRKFVHVPQCPPRRLRELAVRRRRVRVDGGQPSLLIVNDSIPNNRSLAASLQIGRLVREASKIEPALATLRLAYCGVSPPRESKKEISAQFLGLLEEEPYVNALGEATAIVFGSQFRAGHPGRLLEAALCGTTIIVPEKVARRIDARLLPFVESYQPQDVASFAAAVVRSARKGGRPWENIEHDMVDEAYSRWFSVVNDCRRWMRVRSEFGEAGPPRVACAATAALAREATRV